MRITRHGVEWRASLALREDAAVPRPITPVIACAPSRSSLSRAVQRDNVAKAKPESGTGLPIGGPRPARRNHDVAASSRTHDDVRGGKSWWGRGGA